MERTRPIKRTPTLFSWYIKCTLIWGTQGEITPSPKGHLPLSLALQRFNYKLISGISDEGTHPNNRHVHLPLGPWTLTYMFFCTWTDGTVVFYLALVPTKHSLVCAVKRWLLSLAIGKGAWGLWKLIINANPTNEKLIKTTLVVFCMSAFMTLKAWTTRMIDGNPNRFQRETSLTKVLWSALLTFIWSILGARVLGCNDRCQVVCLVSTIYWYMCIYFMIHQFS